MMNEDQEQTESQSEEISAEEAAKNADAVQEEPVSLDNLADLSARRKQLIVDLDAARKDDEGHITAKALEKQLEEIDKKIQPLKEEILRVQEKNAAKDEIGVPKPIISKIIVPKAANEKHVSDYQIHEMFKSKIKAPISVAFNIVKVCDIFEEAASDLYFAHNHASDVIQEGIQALKIICEHVCQGIKDEEEKRLGVKAE
jgi:hypothetical protein